MNLREELRTVGLSEELLAPTESVIRRYLKDEYVTLSRFEEVNDRMKSLAQELSTSNESRSALEKQAKEAQEKLEKLNQSLADTDKNWSDKYKALEDSYRQQEEDRVILEAYDAKVRALTEQLGDSVYDANMITSLIDFDSLDYDGVSVSGVKEAVAQIQKDKPFLFKGDSWGSTAPHSQTNGVLNTSGNFGEALAKKASESDALTKAAEQKYFG